MAATSCPAKRTFMAAGGLQPSREPGPSTPPIGMRSEDPSEGLGCVPMADEELKGGSARFVRGGIQDCLHDYPRWRALTPRFTAPCRRSSSSRALSRPEELDRTGEVGVFIENIVRLCFGRSTRVPARAEQDRLHPELARSEDIAEAIVSNEDRLFWADLQFGQGRLKQAGVRLAIAVVARDDDGREVVGQVGGPKLG